MRRLRADVERGVLAVRRVSWLAAAEVTRGNRLAIALKGKQFDEPRFVLNFLVKNTSGHVVSAWVFTEGDVAHRLPTANGTSFGLEQQRQNVDRSWWIRQFCGCAARLVVECGKVIGQFAAQFVNARNDQ